MVRLPQFSRAVYVVLGVAVLILTITYGGMEIWPRVEAYRRMQSLDRQWRDASLTPSARRKAADMLAEFGPDAAPYLLAAAHHEDVRVRERACAYLAGLDPLPDEAIRICLAALKEDREPKVRASAVGSLGVAAYIIRRTQVQRRQAIIAAIGEAAGGDGSPLVRQAAVRAMVHAVAVNVDPSPWLRDSDRLVRLAAADAIFWLDPTRKRRAVPTLTAMILEANPVRPAEVWRPFGLLLKIDRPSCAALVPTFTRWLGHEDAGVRQRAVGCLAELGPLAVEAIPSLEALLGRGGPAERSGVAMALVVIGPAACDRAVAGLCDLLRDDRIPLRERVVALGPLSIALRHKAVPPRIRNALRDDLRAIREDPGTYPDFGQLIGQVLDAREAAPSRAHTSAPGTVIQ